MEVSCYVVFIMLINVKMPTIVDILTFMSTINFVLSWVEYEKKFYNLGAWIDNLHYKLPIVGNQNWIISSFIYSQKVKMLNDNWRRVICF